MNIRNANVRLTLQATQKNKINFFWDEGLTCQDPCDGAVAAFTSRDGWWSGQVHPARLMQASWTNPLTNVILLEAGLSANRQLYDFSHHRYWDANQDIPWVNEFGTTVGVDATGALNATDFRFLGLPSGPISDGIGGLAESRNLNDWRPRASISFVTGSHNAKFGYDGGYFAQTRRNGTGNTRLEYDDTPAGAVTAVTLRRQHAATRASITQRPVQPGDAAVPNESISTRGSRHRKPGAYSGSTCRISDADPATLSGVDPLRHGRALPGKLHWWQRDPPSLLPIQVAHVRGKTGTARRHDGVYNDFTRGGRGVDTSAPEDVEAVENGQISGGWG